MRILTRLGRDPDIGAGVPFRGLALACWGNRRRPLASWLARWQAPLFFPLMLLRSGACTYSGVRWLLPSTETASSAGGEVSLIPALHAALYLTVVLWVLSFRSRHWLSRPSRPVQAVFSRREGGISFAPNHKGMRGSSKQSARGDQRFVLGGQAVTWPRKYQGRPVHLPVMLWLCVPQLNQIEHTTGFQSMPRPNLRTGSKASSGTAQADRSRLLRRKARRVIPPDRRSPPAMLGAARPRSRSTRTWKEPSR